MSQFLEETTDLKNIEQQSPQLSELIHTVEKKKECKMNKLVPLALKVRLKPWLCRMALALLAACNGGVHDSQAQQQTQPPQLAAAEQAVGAGVIAADREDGIVGLYWWLLGRRPDDSGLQYWLRSGLSEEYIAAQLKHSQELADMHGWRDIGTQTRTKMYVDASTTAELRDGSEGNPFKTLAEAAKAVRSASTTVFVKPGVYEGGFRTATNGVDTVDGYDGRIYWVSTERWGAKIVPASSASREADNTTAWTNTGDYVHIVGFEVDGLRSADPAYDNWRQGIYTGGAHSVVRDNYVHDIARWASCSSGLGGAGINLDAYPRGGLADAIGNWVRDIGQPGAACRRFQGIYVSSSGSVINNVVYRAYAGAAIHLYHEAHAVKVVNNTVAASNIGIVVGTGSYRGAKVEHKDTVVYNNIAYDNYIGVEEYIARDGIMGVNYYGNNLVTGNTRDYAYMTNTVSNTKTGDPGFIDYDKSRLLPNFHLAARSAAIGNGAPEYSYGTDFDGRLRIQSGGACIGAYEPPR